MKIAQIAPLAESVPPKLYGGTERVVSWLTEELVAQGHDVTLFASGDSQTSARLVPVTPQALRLDPTVHDTLGYNIMQLEEVRRRACAFDLLHFHTDLLHAPLVRNLGVPSVTTLHGRLDLPDLAPFFRTFSDLSHVSISDHQRLPVPPVNWAGTIYHGMPLGQFRPTLSRSEGYLAFLGRISPEKRPDRAIRIAARAGIPLRIAAKIDNVDREYWDKVIAPLVAKHEDIVTFVGEIDDRRKEQFLGSARALLFPIDWPEPFGLVMIEAMACGTPVVAFRCGSVPEVIDDNRSGFIVDSEDAALAALSHVENLDRGEVRRCFEERFSAARMALDYVRVYTELIDAPFSAGDNVFRLHEPETRAAPLLA